MADKLKALERENRELRQANEILRKASGYFAQAELDRGPVRISVREAIVMDRKDHRYGDRQRCSGPAAGWP